MIIKLEQLKEGDMLCVECKTRVATLQCDFPVARGHFCGHPPKVNGVVDLKEPMAWTYTCDRPMCEKCAIDMDKGIHICTKCCTKLSKRMNMR